MVSESVLASKALGSTYIPEIFFIGIYTIVLGLLYLPYIIILVVVTIVLDCHSLLLLLGTILIAASYIIFLSYYNFWLP